ncbi:centrosomal protein of 68 kDa isoform X1 [Tupaia chinensis]|uniref:Centrosomal protein of 68 kDa n=1 Tax=Tupaia chinensis TaxID=246437 RepID=L8Y789_TUPCH|nr:centrosomal protein of 68 kDa isoform X1 [Tupaia chinensis]XP_006168110.1 centrosomal protein of 68 kDa isoform X1 [Tupaia chinensis]XP_014439516.1 centrosomal protein of 68 kDa isoform X1 [Tupaia chinensis]ELV10934.1 Centrosomal protein of 68 kDa [Tupaia chinensis]
MALGEEKAEVEASVDTEAQSYRRWSCGEREVDTPGPAHGEQHPRLEAEGGPTSPVSGAEGLPAPTCLSGASQPHANDTNSELVADGSKPALQSLPPPPSMLTGDLLHCVGSQMETKLPASKELPQTPNVPRTALCSGHEADIEDDPSPVDSPRALDLSQPPRISGFPFPPQWKSVGSPGTAAPQLSSCSFSASSTGSSLQSQQEKAEPQGRSLAKVSSSLELVVPQAPTSVVGPGPRPQWSPQPMPSGVDAAGLGRRRLSFQAEYWACVLPDSLPPSPDRHSPHWNPNKEYEDLLDYTYPLRPGPQLSKHLDGHVLADPILQDSGIDLDSFSVSPASTLKSPTNISPNHPPAEAAALPVSGPREPGLKQWPSGVPQKQDSLGLVSQSQLASTPRAPASRDAPWESREPALRGKKDWLPTGKHLEMGSPQLRTWARGWPSPRQETEKGASQSVRRPAYAESRWKPEETESDDEYLALPTRLTQVSSLLSYIGSMPTLVTLPTGAADEQSSLEVSDSDGPASLPSDSSQSQLPSGAALQGPGCPEGQDRRSFRSFIRARDSAGEGSLCSSQARRPSSGLLKTRPSLPAVSDRWPFSDPDAEEQLPKRAGGQGNASLVQCVQTFCCQLEELIHWLCTLADVTDQGTPLRPNLTGLKSSLQLYRQFKKDIDEHQTLTESVLQKGEILLQCLLDNTPVLKDVLGRIAKQSGELESHADRLYDSILSSLDTLAGCTLIPDSKPVAAKERPCERL